MLISLFTSLASSCLLFILDSGIAHYTGSFALFMITSFLIISLFIDTLTYFFLIPFFFIGLESLLFYDNFLLAFYWIMPTILLALYLKNKMVVPLFAASLSIVFCIFLQHITTLLCGYKVPLLHCTVLQIGVNLIFIIMSLKCLPTVEQGNRSL